MPLIEQALPRFRRLLDEVSALSKALHFDSGNEQHFLALALNGAILEQARGIMIVLEQRNVTPAFILLRSLVEAVVDLYNLVNYRNYKKYMAYQFLKEKKRIFSFVQKKPKTDPWSVEFEACPTEVKTQFKQATKELKKFEKEKIKGKLLKHIHTEERFELAEQPNLRGIYMSLCQYSHNNIAALRERHRCETSSGPQVAYFRPPSDEDVEALLRPAARYVAESVTFLYQILCKSELGKVISRLKPMIEEIFPN